MAIVSLKKKFSDAEYVKGVAEKDYSIQESFYFHCKKYFYRHYKSVFFIGKDDADDIFQNTCITVFQHIERGKIYLTEEGVVAYKGNSMRSKLMTYFMSVSKIKYLEWARSTKSEKEIHSQDKITIEDEKKSLQSWNNSFYDDYRDILADCISKLSIGCNQIMTKFYEEEKKLDEILSEMPSYKSKDALKSAKNKCLRRLKELVNYISNSNKSTKL